MGTNIDELKNKIFPVANKYGLDKVYLFGSRARGDNRIDSDYDFFVEAGELKGLFQLSGLFIDLQDVLASEVDIVLDPEGVGTLPEYLASAIERDKVLVYG